ncbi:hypothetical protein BH09PAT2_BH09PAT2_08430 [soil metagenome]
MIKQNSSFVVLYTNDLEKTANFYKKFGITIKDQDHRKCVFELGDFDIHFNNSEDIPEYKYIFEQARGGGSVIYVEVENLENYYIIAKSIDGALKSEIAVRPWDTKEFLFQDPNGYNIVFYEDV